jgi:uncharacterized protein (TIGR02001 family)
MKKVMMYLLACSSMLLSNIALAESPHEFSANVALTTDYMYRGISQSNEGPAVSGGLDYAHESGFYLGTWASSVEFGAGDDDTTLEVDFYGGIGGELSNGISWDVGGLYYMYPNTDADAAGDYDFVEGNLSLGYSFADVTLAPEIGFGFAYSPDFYGEDGDSVYITGTLDLSLPYDFGLSFLVGNLDVDGDKTTPAGFDYTHYSVGLNKSWQIFDFDATYYDSGDSGCSGYASSEKCEAFVFTVSSSF